jgi:2-keto-4-pentenoate hydratase/2-oxohepta-3-ene-1,7-dioic acid hydratase in catechol pathway
VKFVRFDGGRTGLVVDTAAGTTIVDVAASAEALGADGAAITDAIGVDGTGPWVPLIESWDDCSGAFEELVKLGVAGASGVKTLRYDSVTLGPPLPSPRPRIFAPAGNFPQHISAANETAEGESFREGEGTDLPYVASYEENIRIRREEGPAGFWIEPDTVVGPGATVAPPRRTQAFDYEVEGAVVLRSGGRYLKRDDVRIWGQSVWNDLSLRDWWLLLDVYDRGFLNWAFQKNFETGNAFGPWICVDEGPDPFHVRLITRVNGEVRQDARTDDAIFDYAANVEYISRFLPLKAGDILTSGTIHGTAVEDGREGRYLQPGDEVEVEVEGVGVLRNHVGEWEH